MECALETLPSWATNCGLSINPNKADPGLFSRKYKIETFRLTRLGCREFSLFSKFKYLGTGSGQKVEL